MDRGFFVTGTDTGVGKTLVSLGLMELLKERGHRVAGMKPVASGCDVTPAGLRNADALALQARASLQLPYDHVNPCAYEPPVAPHIAATETGQPIDLAGIQQRYRAIAAKVECVVVEGVGGWKVPLNEEQDVSDLARMTGLPVVLVVALRLGCLNHAILALESIESSAVPFAGWVANCMDREMLRASENIDYLSERMRRPPLGIIPALDITPAIAPEPAVRVARLLAEGPLAA